MVSFASFGAQGSPRNKVGTRLRSYFSVEERMLRLSQEKESGKETRVIIPKTPGRALSSPLARPGIMCWGLNGSVGDGRIMKSCLFSWAERECKGGWCTEQLWGYLRIKREGNGQDRWPPPTAPHRGRPESRTRWLPQVKAGPLRDFQESGPPTGLG